MTALQVAIKAKGFGAKPVLEAIGFEAAAGEVLALLAPSGTGKTTALRIILGLDTAFTGTIQRPGGRIGAVFQDPRLLPWMDVAANLRFAEPTLTDAEIQSLLTGIGLPAIAGHTPKQLSLGMARRVAIARALAVRPSLLILDEPFASLDPALAASLSQSVAAQARALGATVIIATHDLDQALETADRILVLAGNAPATLAADLPSATTCARSLRDRFPFLAGTERTAPHG